MNNQEEVWQNLFSLIVRYLKSETNYSIFLRGAWGSGKTYFTKEYLLKKINSEKIECVNSSSTFKAVSVSVFGLESLEQLSSKIILSFFELAVSEKKVPKKGIGLLKSVASLTLKSRLGLDFKKIISDLDMDVIDLRQTLIILDDLERRGESLTLNSVFGLVNDLVENHGAKVMLVSNNIVSDKDEQEFLNLMEKTNGVVYEFPFQLKESVESIINVNFIHQPSY